MNSLLPSLAAKSRMTLADAARIIETAPRRYKVYRIPRKAVGERIIAHPARELKALQRSLIDLFDEMLPVSSAATAYEKGCSIKANAAAHANGDWIAKFDLRSFFNSIKEPVWVQFLQQAGIDNDRIELSRKIFFWLPRGENTACLSVGAPSSPFASNRFMNNYDQQILQFCNDNGFNYTRYADDITISGTGEIDFDNVHNWLKGVVEGPGVFNLNENKSRFLRKGVRRTVTGVVVTNEGRLSIGRGRRRKLEARVHSYVVKQQEHDVDVLRGQLAFLKLIDEDGFQRLKTRFGGTPRATAARLFGSN